MEWMEWNFPTVHARVKRVKQDTRVDYKDRAFQRKYPQQSGRTP